ncbi:MAG: glycosyltransferase involved in cell wall biosynthesis [Urechidicola sp.]|jgi:glycosyltransferase involved in cell wall biosynthesis
MTQLFKRQKMSKKLDILHICNNYAGSTIYKNLFSELDKLGYPQQVYCPVRLEELVGRNKIEFEGSKSEISYSHILNLNTRVNYIGKIKKCVSDIESKLNIDEMQVIHAHTWYSDGGVAYELHKKYKTPYIIAVRNTDLNVFFKYMLHLRRYGKEILKHAEAIVFISPVYKERLLNHPYFEDLKDTIESKALVIPNGIDDFWINNFKPNSNQKVHEIPQLLFIGQLSKGKNILRLQKAIIKLSDNGKRCHLDIVGQGGNAEEKVLKVAQVHPDLFTVHGQVKDKEKLMTIFEQNDLFAMPSTNETFGLVYIEALTQGLPVIYTKNEGIYGFFDGKIGEAVDCYSVDDIAKSIKKIIMTIESYNYDVKKIVKEFNWRKISRNYEELYLNNVSVEQANESNQ